MLSLYITPKSGDWEVNIQSLGWRNNSFYTSVLNWLNENGICLEPLEFEEVNGNWMLRLDFQNEEDLNFFRLSFKKEINQIQL